ncbi:MAG: beta strand repeat-containing protein [Chloroflexota bacterium]
MTISSSFGVQISGNAIALQSGGSITDTSAAGDGVNVALTLNGPATIATSGSATNLSFSGAITGTGGLTLTNNSADENLSFSGAAETYSGTTTVSGAYPILVNTGASLPASTAVNIVSGGIRLRTSNTVGSLSGGGLIANASGGALTLTVGGDNTSTTYSGVVEDVNGALSLTKQGSGTLTLSGANTYTGGTTVSAGTLQGTTTSLQGNVTDNGAVTFNQASNGTYAGNLSGTGGVTVSGGGTVTLSGSNTYSGATTVSAGGLTLNSSLASSAVSVSSGAILALGGNATVASLAGAGNVALGANTLTTGGDNTGTTFSGVLSGTGGVTKNGTGNLTLSGSNTSNGTLTVNGGTVTVSGTWNGPVTVNSGGTLVIASGGHVNGTVTNNGGTVQNNNPTATPTPTNTATATPTATGTQQPTSTFTSTPQPTSTAAPSGGGGGGGAPAPSGPTAGGHQLIGYTTSFAGLLGQTGTTQVGDYQVTIPNPQNGFTLIVDSMGLAVPPGALGPGQISVTVSGGATVTQGMHFGLLDLSGATYFGPQLPAPTIPGGPARYSPNGTIFGLSIADASGNPITSVPAVAQLGLAWNAADVSMADGNANVLMAAYMVDGNSPALANPNHEPAGTWVFFPPSGVSVDQAHGLMVVNTQLISGLMSVFANPVGYVQTLTPNAALYSSFDPASSQRFGAKPQFSYLQVAEPQVGSRLHVLDPATRNYAYVNATDVGPSGAPPS